MENQHLSLHQDNQQSVHIGNPKHVEQLCRHLFKDSPKGMQLVEKTFGKQAMPIELKNQRPVNRLIHEPYSAS